ncbi:MAG: 3-hydroxyacyl-ACP dehydratase FabZ [Holosporales bacterium]|jgi:3-hydroxyacyl-[acyl-carrier-protein] dehydratase|nr:3-hydroxyacyl-ACP dehydratase FabZ [Holosporales bacterium]
MPDQRGEVLDAVMIRRCLPHRYPLLMIDRVEQLECDKRAVGVRCISSNDPFFQGHFPNHPVLPGVLIIEAMAQTAGVLVVRTLKLMDSGKLVYFMSVEEARFRKPVFPGTTLYLDVEKERNRGTVWRFKGCAYSEQQLMAEAVFTAIIMDPQT